MKSFFIDKKDININDEIKLNEIEHNHLSKVLRMKVGEYVLAYPNDDRVVTCQILRINKKESILKVIKIDKSTTNPKNKVDVFTALLKGEKFEFLITKLTELGVNKIIPFESEFCIGKNSNNKNARFLQIAKDACKQCKRSKTIDIEITKTFNDMLDLLKNYDLIIFAYERELMSNLSSVLEKVKKGMKIALILGSEGGFTENEAEKIIKYGAVVVSLGNRILRAETASLMLSSLVLNKLGEYDIKNS